MADRPHVLIVEDNADIADGLREILEAEGYDVSTAVNGMQALFFLDGARDGRPPPSVIVLDMMMPIMDGHTFRSEQLQRHAGVASIPVIGWTAYDHLRPTDFEIVRKSGPPSVLLERIRAAAGPGVTAPPKKPRISTRRLGVIAAVIAAATTLLKTILDHIFPSKKG